MVHTQATEYLVSPVDPSIDSEARHWQVEVSWRGPGDRWAVKHWGSVLNAAGEKEYEPLPSNREDDFIARTRFPLKQALKLAQDMVPTLTANGSTYAQWRADVPLRDEDA